MMTQIENDLLFDDAGALENTLGETRKNLTSLSADCDCISYTEFPEDDDSQ